MVLEAMMMVWSILGAEEGYSLGKGMDLYVSKKVTLLDAGVPSRLMDGLEVTVVASVLEGCGPLS